MRQINEDRRRRTLLLLKRLDEFAVVRRYLVDQLEELDAKARDVQIEVNRLQPISILPDEMLAVVFEIGSLLPQKPQVHFGSLVSHVSQHWRKIAMATPRLWNKIYCIQPQGEDYDASYYGCVQRDAAFLERSRLFPVEIYISSFMENEHFSSHFIGHIRDHIGKCSRLSITAPDSLWISRALEYLLCQPVPLMSSIELALQDGFDEDFELDGLVPLSLRGALHLTTAQIHGIHSAYLPFCLPRLTNVTSLQLTKMWIIDDGSPDHAYEPLRDTLMALQALDHLELQLYSFSKDYFRPIVMPTIRFLQIKGLYQGQRLEDREEDVFLDDIIHSIYAESLITLSIDGWNRSRPSMDFSSNAELKSHFPSLQHLILCNISPDVPDLRVVACRFPGIERLTCHAQEPLNPATSDIYHVITHTTPRPGYRENDEEDEGDATSSSSRQRWPKLHTIAVTASDTPLDVVALHDEISRLQEGGHPIRKLKLPNHLCQMAGAEAMVHLRTIIQVDDFSMDWPTPFEFIKNPPPAWYAR